MRIFSAPRLLTMTVLTAHPTWLTTGDQDALVILKGMSSVAWQNINLFGCFEFNPSSSKVDNDALVAHYADPT